MKSIFLLAVALSHVLTPGVLALDPATQQPLTVDVICNTNWGKEPAKRQHGGIPNRHASFLLLRARATQNRCGEHWYRRMIYQQCPRCGRLSSAPSRGPGGDSRWFCGSCGALYSERSAVRYFRLAAYPADDNTRDDGRQRDYDEGQE